jgi:hypothetical protein
MSLKQFTQRFCYAMGSLRYGFGQVHRSVAEKVMIKIQKAVGASRSLILEK